MPQLSLSVTLGWQFSLRAQLKMPFAKPGLTTGASRDRRSRYESTPPSGRLVSDPPLPTGRNVLLVPLSRNCTHRVWRAAEHAGERWHSLNGGISVQSLSHALSHLQVRFVFAWVLHDTAFTQMVFYYNLNVISPTTKNNIIWVYLLLKLPTWETTQVKQAFATDRRVDAIKTSSLCGQILMLEQDLNQIFVVFFHENYSHRKILPFELHHPFDHTHNN